MFEWLKDLKRAVFSSPSAGNDVIRLGREDYKIDYSNPHKQQIHVEGKSYVIMEHGAVSSVQEAFQHLIAESEKTGAEMVVADVNGRVVVATYAMSVEQVEGIYRHSCKTVPDAYAQFQALKQSLRDEVEAKKAAGSASGSRLNREEKSGTDHILRGESEGGKQR